MTVCKQSINKTNESKEYLNIYLEKFEFNLNEIIINLSTYDTCHCSMEFKLLHCIIIYFKWIDNHFIEDSLVMYDSNLCIARTNSIMFRKESKKEKRKNLL